MWNSKVGELRAIAIAEQLSEGTSYKGTSRLTRSNPETVRRLAKRLGKHGEGFHDEKVMNLGSTALQGDKCWGYVAEKSQQVWEAEVIDPASRLVVARAQGERDESLIRKVLTTGKKRLSRPQEVVLFSDGEPSYPKLFKDIFGQAYRPARRGTRGRLPKLRYRLGRQQAHAQVIKQREGHSLVKVVVRLSHGSHKRLQLELDRLAYNIANTSVIERRNATARRMDAFSVRKSLSFARSPESRDANGSWSMTVYNWARPHRALKSPLPQPIGKRLFQHRSPAMAAGLTHFIWSVQDILRFQLAPSKDTG
ncbi:MAG: IS1 transposase [Deinococcales bacterium]